MIAFIGDGEHDVGSVGVFENVGFKHDGWRDTALMQRVLGEGRETTP